ncbi:MAG TPA: hypothetical protein PKA42_03445 [Candidatus Paceibacterota bacterium]|nr:hypothetical protein [Candidatus Paceibacterota bacterium]HMO83197.1 hypothetical protein [Candidatus Paceibacterota bacterium]
MFFKKKSLPSLTDLLSESINKDYERFVGTIFKDETLTSEQKIETAIYLLFLYVHVMLIRELPANISLEFPTNPNVLSVLNDQEKAMLLEKYQERMPIYVEAFTELDNKMLALTALFLSNFYNIEKNLVVDQKAQQLVQGEMYSMIILKNNIEIINLCTQHNNL